jgi:RNA polymerase sigma factor (sigma-70 family)
MDIDVLEYKSVIERVLSRLKIPADQREDLSQECYVALLEKKHHVQKGIDKGKGEAYAARICRSRITDLWRTGQRPQRTKEDPGPRLVSLSLPKIMHQAEKIPQPVPEVSDEELYGAIYSLPLDEYRVIYNVFVDGKSQRETAGDFGISRRQVANLVDRGIKNLKKYFEVGD